VSPGSPFKILLITGFCFHRLPVIIRNTLILIIAFASFGVTALVTYLNNYNGIFILEPEAVKYGLFYMEAFKKLYIPTHTNMGCYFVGIVAGFCYDLILRHKININQFKAFRIVWFLLIVFGFFVVIAGYFAYENSQESTVWKYVFALVDKNVWGILAAFFAWGLITKVGGPVRRLINVPLFRFLGKTSYCAYLWHVLVLRILIGSFRQPFYSGNTSYVSDRRVGRLILFLNWLIFLPDHDGEYNNSTHIPHQYCLEFDRRVSVYEFGKDVFHGDRAKEEDRSVGKEMEHGYQLKF
jgi:Acyltransferase family